MQIHPSPPLRGSLCEPPLPCRERLLSFPNLAHQSILLIPWNPFFPLLQPYGMTPEHPAIPLSLKSMSLPGRSSGLLLATFQDSVERSLPPVPGFLSHLTASRGAFILAWTCEFPDPSFVSPAHCCTAKSWDGVATPQGFGTSNQCSKSWRQGRHRGTRGEG